MNETTKKLLEVLEMVDHCHLVKDDINGQLMWLTHQSVVEAVKDAIKTIKENSAK